MIDPTNPAELSRLQEAMEISRQKLKPFRENRLYALRQYVGQHYGEMSSDLPVPISFVEMAVSIYTHNLVGGPPRAMVRTRHPQMMAAAADLQVVLDHVMEEIRLEETLASVVADAMFGMGIVKVGLTEGPIDQIKGFWHDQWQPYVDRVDLDDWVQDMTATSWEECGFMGNRYRIPLAVAREAPEFDPRLRSELKATLKSDRHDDTEMAYELAGGDRGDRDEPWDYTELWDIWLPQDRLLITLPCDGKSRTPLRTIRWSGPEIGPFLTLGFNYVPSNIMPLPPTSIWIDLHDLANDLHRKLGRQAIRQKTILPVRGANPDDVESLRDEQDGGICRVDAEVPKEVRFGGPDQVNLAFLLSNLNLFNRQAGNLETLGGLNTGAETLGQEQMMMQNASNRIQSMRKRVNRFTSDIMNSMAYYLFDDPFVNFQLERPVQGTSVRAPVVWNDEVREQDFREFNIQIEPYSMVYKSPQMEMQQLMMLFQSVIMPCAPFMQQQGIEVNFEGLLRTLAKYADFKELDSILTFNGRPTMYTPGPVGTPQPPSGGVGRQGPAGPPGGGGGGPRGEGGNTALAQALLGKVNEAVAGGGL